jgi:hypothetical protein
MDPATARWSWEDECAAAAVHGRWPGLGKGQLYEDRDLAVTTDFRDLFAELAGAQLGISTAALFPGMHRPRVGNRRVVVADRRTLVQPSPCLTSLSRVAPYRGGHLVRLEPLSSVARALRLILQGLPPKIAKPRKTPRGPEWPKSVRRSTYSPGPWRAGTSSSRMRSTTSSSAATPPASSSSTRPASAPFTPACGWTSTAPPSTTRTAPTASTSTTTAW